MYIRRMISKELLHAYLDSWVRQPCRVRIEESLARAGVILSSPGGENERDDSYLVNF